MTQSSSFSPLTMTRRVRWCALLAVTVLTFSGSASVAKELEDRHWIEARSPNFRIRSALSEKDTVELARYLETFRVAVSVVTNISSTESPIPTNVYVFQKQKDFARFDIDKDVAGLLMPGLRDYMILVRDVRGMTETSIILHEYVHFLVRNHNRLHYPKWFDEGFAEYLSAARIRRKKFQVGFVPQHRLGSLQYSGWINLAKIIDSEPHFEEWRPDQVSMFYAESWALVHYLLSGREGPTRFSDEMAHYIQLVEQDQNHLTAFETAFGMTIEDANKAVRRYLKKGRFSYMSMPESTLVPDLQIDTSSLTREEISLELGKLALRRRELEQAREWFTIAAEQSSTRAQAMAGLGDVEKFQDNWAAALPYFQTAVALAPEDPYVQLDMAEYWHDRAKVTDETAEQQLFLLRARQHYVAAWKIDNAMPEGYAMYGTTFLIGDPDPNKAIEMLEEAHYLLPSDLDIRLQLAEAYTLVKRFDEAETQARSILAWGHADSGLAERARALLAKLGR